MMPLTSDDLTERYDAMAAPFPKESVERTSGAPIAQGGTGRGYNTTGIGYQYIANRLNEVLGPAHWRVVSILTASTDTKAAQSGRTRYEYVADVTVQIGNPGDPFEVLAERQAMGGHIAMSIADAMKGAMTNGFKKASGMFGVGREAYEGSIDDDNEPIPAAEAEPPAQQESREREQPATKEAEADPAKEQRRAFAVMAKLLPDLEKAGITDRTVWDSIMAAYDVKSRSALTGGQWTAIANRLDRAQYDDDVFKQIVARARQLRGEETEPKSDDVEF